MASLGATTYLEHTESLESSRESLIIEHLPQVRWIATRIHEKLPNSTCIDDLVSIGIIGLINAIDNFDPQLNVKLKTYAEHKIRGAILDSIRGMDGIPPHKRKRLKQVQTAINALGQSLKRAPVEEEIAAKLKITLNEYQDWLLELRGVTIGSLDAPTNEDDSRNLLHFLADDESNSPTRVLERAELEKLVEDGVNAMPRMERLVLDLYYRQEQNLSEIAPILNLHITRVSQIKTQAIVRLRGYIERRWSTPLKGGH